LVAREHIRDVIARYARAGDANNDPEAMGRLFTEDAVWEAEGFGRFEGSAAIRRELAQIGRDRILWSLHFPVSPLIEVDDDHETATAFWWLSDAWRISHLSLRIQKLVESAEGPNEVPDPRNRGQHA
jgi:hypothetical protein